MAKKPQPKTKTAAPRKTTTIQKVIKEKLLVKFGIQKSVSVSDNKKDDSPKCYKNNLINRRYRITNLMSCNKH